MWLPGLLKPVRLGAKFERQGFKPLQFDEKLVQKGFALALYLSGGEPRPAAHLLIDSIEFVRTKNTRQDSQLRHDLKSFRARKRVVLTNDQCLQVGVCEKSTAYEQDQEAEQFPQCSSPAKQRDKVQYRLSKQIIDPLFAGEGEDLTRRRSLTEEDMIIRFTKHLILICVSHNSYDLAIGLGSLLYDYGPQRALEIYEDLDTEGLRGGVNPRNKKSGIRSSIERRFGKIFTEADDRAGVLAECYSTVQESLRRLTLWGTECILPKGFENNPDIIASELQSNSDDPDAGHQIEHARIHTLTCPDCFERLIRRKNVARHRFGAGRGSTSPAYYPPPAEALHPWQLSTNLNGNGNGHPPKRESQSALTPAQLEGMRDVLEELYLHRQQAPANVLIIDVDGREQERFDLSKRQSCQIQLQPESRLIEVYTGSEAGDLLIASCWLPELAGENKVGEIRTSVVNERGQQITFKLNFNAETEEQTGGVVNIVYRETDVWRAMKLQWARLKQGLADKFTAPRRLHWSEVMAKGVSLVLAAALIFVAPRGTAVSAAMLLEKVAAVEQSHAKDPKQITHRILNLTELDPQNRAVIARRRIEIWEQGLGGLKIRREFDVSGRLLAGEWRHRGAIYRSRNAGRGASEEARSTINIVYPALGNRAVWQMEPTAASFTQLIGRGELARAQERPDAWLIEFEAAPPPAQGLLRAALTLDPRDWRAKKERLTIRYQNALREYLLVEESLTRSPIASFPAKVFEPEPELVQVASRQEPNVPAAPGLPAPAGSPQQSKAFTPASPELEIQVAALIAQIGADQGREVTVYRTPDGRLRLEGVIENARRKEEILAALAPVIKDPAIIIEIETKEEAIKRISPKIVDGALIEQRAATAHRQFVGLRREFESVFELKNGVITREQIDSDDPPELIRALNQLAEIASQLDEKVRDSFTMAAPATPSSINSAEFWRLLHQAESLSAGVQTAANKLKISAE